MLIEFRMENHRSIRDEEVFTMEAGRIGHPGDPRERKVAGHSKKLLTVAALYGANASGKSNLLSALGFMRDAVIDSHPSWPPEGGVPRDAFAWGSRVHEPSMFETTILIGSVRYRYGFLVDQTRVLEEWLFAWPRARRQAWFEREGDEYTFGESLRGENRLVKQVTRPNALFLSTAAQHQHEQLLPIYQWFRHMRTIRIEGYKERYSDAMPVAFAAAFFAAAAAAAAASAESTNGMIRVSELLPRHRKQHDATLALDATGTEKLRQLVSAADVGISDFRIDKAPSRSRPTEQEHRIFMRHTVGSDAWLPLEQESAGTKALFHLGPAVIEALTNGRLLIIDELEASLHPLIAIQLVSRFNDQKTNPHNAQLVFTTHDTSLLGTTLGDPPLRRDQIWLTEKNPEGATTLYPLTDYKPRKAENLERGYLQGRYGAIPFLGDLANPSE
ncbi:MAG: ATP-binding protein [Deltaproteobacteria bacterium]|nr:ATP-binding protein [Deltaproteobacteria bacterium]